jgi:fibronectin type 3 domain-containing protein
MSGVSFPLTLNEGQTATLTVSFDPSTTTPVTGTITLTSNSSTNPSVISLSGTGQTGGAGSYQVNLTWDAPTDSSDPAIVGYYIFRALAGSTTYQQLNPTGEFDTQTSYSDTSVASGTTYDYYVESVDSSGVESAPSGIASVTVP